MHHVVLLNPCVDYFLSVEQANNQLIQRCEAEGLVPGGKAYNVLFHFHRLGLEATCLTTLGQGLGDWYLESLRGLSSQLQLYRLPGDLRLNVKVQERFSGRCQEWNPQSAPFPQEALAWVQKTLSQSVQPNDVVVLSGSLPQGLPSTTYATLVRLSHEHGAKVILDSSGNALLEGIRAGADLIKPNREEAMEVLERAGVLKAGEEWNAVRLGRELRALGAKEVLLTQGGDEVYYASQALELSYFPRKRQLRRTVGAGDCFLGSFLVARERGLSTQESLQFADEEVGAYLG